jgi:hypothetical protein
MPFPELISAGEASRSSPTVKVQVGELMAVEGVTPLRIGILRFYQGAGADALIGRLCKTARPAAQVKSDGCCGDDGLG